LLPYDVITSLSSDYWTDIIKPAVNVYGFRFRSEQLQPDLAIPEEPALLAYMMSEMRIVGNAIDTTPEELVERNHRHCALTATSVPQTCSIPLPERTFLVHPNTNAKTPITSFLFKYRLVPVAQLINKESVHEDHYLLGTSLQDELAKRNSDVDPNQMQSGFSTTFRFGKYYYNPRLQFSYYCESAKKGTAKLVLLESYQGAQLVQARFKVDTASAKKYVEITNSEEVVRLAKLYETFKISDKNLEGRFTEFVRTIENAECIDDLDLTPEQEKTKRADFFFNRRAIISEFKSLQTDTSAKIATILEPYRDSPEWPMLYGEQELQRVLSFLPNGKEINTQIAIAVTDSIESVIESANRQIRSTKNSFGLPNAGGLLVIFNEDVAVLAPDVVAFRVRKTLRKKTQSGDVRYPHVNTVIVINTGHYSQLTPQLKGIPILIIPSALPDPNGVEAFANSLLPQWSTFDRQPLLKVKTEDFPKLKFERFEKPQKSDAPKSIKRYEYWRLQYGRRRYLQSLDDEQLVKYGQELFEDLAPRFFKGAPETPQNVMAGLMERFTHLLEETGLRGLDLRRLYSEEGDQKERLESLYNDYNHSEN
jgi:hypothetical protein